MASRQQTTTTCYVSNDNVVQSVSDLLRRYRDNPTLIITIRRVNSEAFCVVTATIASSDDTPMLSCLDVWQTT